MTASPTRGHDAIAESRRRKSHFSAPLVQHRFGISRKSLTIKSLKRAAHSLALRQRKQASIKGYVARSFIQKRQANRGSKKHQGRSFGQVMPRSRPDTRGAVRLDPGGVRLKERENFAIRERIGSRDENISLRRLDPKMQVLDRFSRHCDDKTAKLQLTFFCKAHHLRKRRLMAQKPRLPRSPLPLPRLRCCAGRQVPREAPSERHRRTQA